MPSPSACVAEQSEQVRDAILAFALALQFMQERANRCQIGLWREFIKFLWRMIELSVGR